MKTLSKWTLMLTALLLTSTLVFAQTQKPARAIDQGAPRVSELGRALGDDCTNPYMVDMTVLPVNYTDNQPTGTCGHGNTYDVPAIFGYDNGEDVVYRLQPSKAAEVTITLNGENSPFDGKPWHSVSVFEGCPGVDEPLAYEDADGTNNLISINCVLQANTEYFVLVDYWGITGDMCLLSYDITIDAVEAHPRLEAEVDPIDLGEWPVNGWQQCTPVKFVNNGDANASVTNIELDDPDNAFEIVAPVGLPYTLEVGNTAALSKVVGKPTTAGPHTAVYAVNYGVAKGVSTTHINLNAYDAPVGDIFENPFVAASLPYNVTGQSTAAMHKNYMPDVADNGKDVVYKFTLDTDKLVDVTVANNTDDISLKLYDETFKGKPGPMSANVVASTDVAGWTAQPLFAGTYYIVVAGSNAANDITFDLAINAVEMPAPLKPYDPSPVDGAMDVAANGTSLTWKFPEHSKEYRLSYGTTYPPTDVLVDWTAVAPQMMVQGGSYDLPAMMPNMQYFWRVDVRNTTATTNGDVWGFTTVLTAPENLTAVVVDTNDVNLTWELDLAKAFRSYNVYRDGAQIATGVTTTTYTDMDLAHGCYTYQVEAVYDEGVSAKTENVEACIIGTAMVNGTVTDVTTGEPIEGATVALDGDVDYTFTTDANGNYSGEVWEGTYDYTASADHYLSQTLTAVVIAWEATVTKDFALDDDPQPLDGDIIAVELSDTKVEVRWGEESSPNPAGGWTEDFESGALAADWEVVQTNTNATAGPVAAYWTINEGSNSNFAPFGTYHAGLWWDLGHQDEWLITNEFACPTAATFTFSAVCYEGSTHGDHYYVKVSTDGGTTWTELWDATALTSGAWNYYSTPYNIDLSAYAGQNIKLAFNAVDGDGQGLWYVFFVDNLEVSGTSGKGGFITQLNYEGARQHDGNTVSHTSVSRDGKSYPILATNNPKGTRELKGYNVYRVACFDETQEQYLGYTLDSMFTDNNWGDVSWGSYKWGVETKYTNSVSEKRYSNCLDKDMRTVVNVKVITNSGDSPAGTTVTLTNLTEPALNWKHTFVLNDTGMASCDTIRKGHYDIEVKKGGFATINEMDITIEDTTSLEWMLIEEFYAPLDLWVSPTGYAVWKAPVIVDAPGANAIDESFDEVGVIPTGWTVEDNGSTPGKALWEVVSDYKDKTLDGTSFAFIDSDAAGSGTTLDAYLVSPAVDNSSAANVTLQFDQNYQHIATFGFSAVEVWNGSEWVEVLKQEEDAPISSTGLTINSWDDGPDVQTLDVTAHKNAAFQVRFHYVGSWAWYWAIDNVKVYDNTATPLAKTDRAIQGYKVWLDEIYKADTPETWYQHDVSGLTPGEDYTTEVATLFSTGLSDKIDYTWTYVPCDQFDGPKGVSAEGIEGTYNANVVWTYNGVAGQEWTEDFEAGDVPADWEIVQTNTNSAAGSAAGYWTINEAASTDFAPFGTYHAGLWWDYGHQDEWLITKAFVCPTAATFTFSAVCYEGSTYGDHYYVKVSEDDGATWTELWDASAITSDAWNHYDTPYSLDLSAYAGKNIKLAFQAVDGDGQGLWYIFFVDNVAVSTAKNKHAIVFDELSYESKARQAGKVMSDPACAKDGIAQTIEISAPQAPKFNRDLEHLGTNVYRDGEFLTFVPNPDTAYVDEDLTEGTTYRYCVAAVYTNDGGEHTWTSCLDAVCTDFTLIIPEDCLAPKNLTVEDLSGDGKKITLNWQDPTAANFDPTWLQYDDGVNVDAIGTGGEATFAVAHKYPVGSMDAYAGGVITKVKMYIKDAPISTTIKVWQGANVDMIYEEDVTVTPDSWNEFTLNTPVAYDITQDLYVGYSINTAGFTPGVGAQTNVDGDWMYFNDEWAHMVDIVPSLTYTWNLGFYVEGAKGNVAEMPVLVDNTNYTTGAANFSAVTAGINGQDPYANTVADRDLLGYNVYRDGVKVNADLVTDLTYVEMNLPGGVTYCWQVTAVYEYCGESDFSNEVCKEIYEGVEEYANHVNIYPNPAKEYVKINASSVIEQIRITNMAGQLVRHMEAVSATNTTIDTQSLGAGVYFVEVNTINGAKKVKLVITK